MGVHNVSVIKIKKIVTKIKQTQKKSAIIFTTFLFYLQLLSVTTSI